MQFFGITPQFSSNTHMHPYACSFQDDSQEILLEEEVPTGPEKGVSTEARKVPNQSLRKEESSSSLEDESSESEETSPSQPRFVQTTLQLEPVDPFQSVSTSNSVDYLFASVKAQLNNCWYRHLQKNNGER